MGVCLDDLRDKWSSLLAAEGFGLAISASDEFSISRESLPIEKMLGMCSQ